MLQLKLKRYVKRNSWILVWFTNFLLTCEHNTKNIHAPIGVINWVNRLFSHTHTHTHKKKKVWIGMTLGEWLCQRLVFWMMKWVSFWLSILWVWWRFMSKFYVIIFYGVKLSDHSLNSENCSFIHLDLNLDFN